VLDLRLKDRNLSCQSLAAGKFFGNGNVMFLSCFFIFLQYRPEIIEILTCEV
jgi:hypothetical protein